MINVTVSGRWPNEKSPGYPPMVKLSFKSEENGGTDIRLTSLDAVALVYKINKVLQDYRFPRKGMVPEAEKLGISFRDLCRRIGKYWPNGDGDTP